MQSFPQYPPTVILRHKKENLKKCSLRGLESRSDCKFYTYPKEDLPTLERYCLLHIDGKPLTKEDSDQGILLIDGTWRYAERMANFCLNKQSFELRTLPGGWKTAYPRKQDDCSDPEKGLASVEALFIAYHIMGRDTWGLMDHYYWKDKFLEINRDFLPGF